MAHAGDDGRRLPTLQPGEAFAGRYQIVKQLGKGLLGELYQVKHLRYGQNLVLKVYYPGTVATPESRLAFKSEFDRLKQAKHPGVVRYFEQGDWVEADTKYCTMEFINGYNLRTLMNDLKAQGHPISPQDAIQILQKLLETLKAVHPSGVTHRNIKPEEVMIVARGKAQEQVQWDLRLSDFALATAPVDWITEVSPEKLPYMAPEVKGYGGTLGPRADVFSVGALFYEMVTGHPWDESTPASRRKPSLPKKIDDVLELSLAQSTSDRFDSADAMLQEINQLALHSFDDGKLKMSKWTPVYVLLGLAVLGAFIFYLYNLKPEAPVQTLAERWQTIRDAVRNDPKAQPETPDQIAAAQGKEKGMIYVPAGVYLSGALPEEPNMRSSDPRAENKTADGTRYSLFELKGFYIDQYEFPNKPGEVAKTGLNYIESEAECNKLGKRLCTSQEWERACKGDQMLIYSYGDQYDEAKCPKQPGTVDASPECKSSFGVMNLSGGVPEWTFGAAAGSETRRIIKGGQVGAEAWGTRCAAVTDDAMTFNNPSVGFRCCK